MVYQRYKVDEKLRVCKLIEKGYSTYWIERNLGIPPKNRKKKKT